MFKNQPSAGVLGEPENPGRRFFSFLFTLLTVVASVTTLLPFLQQPQAMQAAVPFVPVPGAPTAYSHVIPAAVPVQSDTRSCILESTSVSTKVVGYTARVTVKQVFKNPNSQKFDAVYTFPLSDSGAVDEMTMRIGNRVIRGEIKEKQEAQAIYQRARQNGQTASLLEQQRTNIFTQSVANVEPGESIEITLKYTDLLSYENGKYTFVFPTKVGPRFSPSGSNSEVYAASSLAADTAPYSNLNIDVAVHGAMLSMNGYKGAANSVHNVVSKLQPLDTLEVGMNYAHAVCRPKNMKEDFILTWDVLEDAIASGVVAHRDSTGGYLTAMIMPPHRVSMKEVAPKEMVFLIDCSGSQSGSPLDKAKETLHYIVDKMNPQDTFQIVAFSDDVSEFAPRPLPVSAGMKHKAHQFIDGLSANGGTWVAPAVQKVCSTRPAENRLRIVTFMTDGFISNDYEVMGLIKKLRGNSRWFSFGTGNSVNRTLIDGIAKEGGGEAEYVLLNADGKEIARKFYERIASPVLTDATLRFEGVQVQDVYPKQLSDVWAQRPLYFHARYTGGGDATAIISGFAGGKPYEQRVPVRLPSVDTENLPVAQTWARAKIDDLMSQDWKGVQDGNSSPKVKEQITNVALQHHLMSQFTSFVAVDGVKQSSFNESEPDITPWDATQSRPTQTVLGAQQAPNVQVTAAAPTVAAPTSPQLSDAFSTVVSQLNSLNAYSAGPSENAVYPNAPHLQGASNGTIGPIGSDAVVIAGVNTAGAVRVNTEQVFDLSGLTLPNNYTGLQLFALAIMWLASLHLLFGRKRKKAVSTVSSDMVS